MRAIAFALLVLAAAPAAASPPDAPEGKSCVILSRVIEQRIADDHTIYFREGSRWYRNDLAAACPGLDPEKALRSQVPTDRLCSGDPVTVFERVSNFTYGGCPLGRFTRVDAPPPPPRRR